MTEVGLHCFRTLPPSRRSLFFPVVRAPLGPSPAQLGSLAPSTPFSQCRDQRSLRTGRAISVAGSSNFLILGSMHPMPVGTMKILSDGDPGHQARSLSDADLLSRVKGAFRNWRENLTHWRGSRFATARKSNPACHHLSPLGTSRDRRSRTKVSTAGNAIWAVALLIT